MLQFQLIWYDGANNLINDAQYNVMPMRNSEKLYEAHSRLTITPTKRNHNTTYRCEAWNEADDLRSTSRIGEVRQPAVVRLLVQYAPSVTIEPVSRGPVTEGDKVSTMRLDIRLIIYQIIGIVLSGQFFCHQLQKKPLKNNVATAFLNLNL